MIGNVGGMALGSVTAFMLYRRLPWLTAHDNAPPIVAAAPPEQVFGPGWIVRRMLADFTESPFFGNEWASAGLIAGCCWPPR